MSILALNYTFLCQNRLKMGFSNLNLLQKAAEGCLMQDWVFRLGWPQMYSEGKKVRSLHQTLIFFQPKTSDAKPLQQSPVIGSFYETESKIWAGQLGS